MFIDLPGVHAAPNIQGGTELYEIENIAVDPEQKIEAAMRAVQDWQGKVVLDLGAGTGFHVPRFHQTAAHVVAIEPDDTLRSHIMQRAVQHNLTRVSIIKGSAAQVPLPDQSVDVVHARFAYFFAPNCEPGVRELERIIKPGGTAFIIDNDLEIGTFAAWLGRLPWIKTTFEGVCAFWEQHGFQLERIPSEWRFNSREDLEAVVRLEFGDELGSELLQDHTGLSVDYHYALFHRTY